MKITAAQAILKIIKEHGSNVVYGYPGAAIAPLYDKLAETDLRHILVRNEQSSAHAASSYFKMTGKVGVCISTSGPGATNLITGIANAYMDSIPLIAITGQVACPSVGKDSFQEVDVTGVTTPITKQNYLVKNAEDIVRVMREAFYIAGTGRPGPVVVDVPMDVLCEMVEFTPFTPQKILGYNPEPKASDNQIKKLAKMLKSAKRPLFVLGGGVLSAGASRDFTRLVEKLNVPVVSTLMGISGIASSHKQYLGMAGQHGTFSANEAFARADTLVFAGARVSDRAVFAPKSLSERARIIHLDIDPAEINKNIPANLSIIANIKDVTKKLIDVASFTAPDAWMKECIGAKVKNIKAEDSSTPFVNPKLFIKKLSEKAPADAIISTEVGQHQIWAANHYNFKEPNTFLTSGGFGTMGYGFPAALGAKIACPDKTVIALEGDGSFQMVMPELATMKQFGANVKIVLFVNRSLGLVREYQKLYHNSNFSCVDLGDYPHFDKIAAAYDIAHLRVSNNSEIDSAIDEFLLQKGSFILEVLVSDIESTL